MELTQEDRRILLKHCEQQRKHAASWPIARCFLVLMVLVQFGIYLYGNHIYDRLDEVMRPFAEEEVGGASIATRDDILYEVTLSNSRLRAEMYLQVTIMLHLCMAAGFSVLLVVKWNQHRLISAKAKMMETVWLSVIPKDDPGPLGYRNLETP